MGHVKCLEVLGAKACAEDTSDSGDAAVHFSVFGGCPAASDLEEYGHPPARRRNMSAEERDVLTNAWGPNGRCIPYHRRDGNGRMGDTDCLELLSGVFAINLCASNRLKWTPAHLAARVGNVAALKVLHRLMRKMIRGPLRDMRALAGQFNTQASMALLGDMEARMHLAWSPDDSDVAPLLLAARYAAKYVNDYACERLEALDYLVSVGGATAVMAKVKANPGLLDTARYAPILETNRHSNLIDFPLKQQWLSQHLTKAVDDAGRDSIVLVAWRDNVMGGVLESLGVDSDTGTLIADADAAMARGVEVTFESEHGMGDGVRREWLQLVVGELLDPARGLFSSKDGNRTLQPSPHSATTAGADHLAYFTVLGRVAGLSLYHREPLNAAWTTSFIKAVMGFPISPTDLATVDPEMYTARIVYLRDSVYSTKDGIAIEDLDLTFVDDSNDEAIVYESKEDQRASVELTVGGATIAVTESNKSQYIRLLVQYRLVGSIRPQIEAFRRGLAVFLTDPLRASLRSCCTVADVQLLLCGVATIDVDDWKTATKVGIDFMAFLV